MLGEVVCGKEDLVVVSGKEGLVVIARPKCKHTFMGNLRVQVENPFMHSRTLDLAAIYLTAIIAS